MMYTLGFSMWFAAHSVRCVGACALGVVLAPAAPASCVRRRLDRIRSAYNKRRSPGYPFWSAVVLGHGLQWFVFALVGELVFITADARTLNGLAEARDVDCGYPSALLLAFLALNAVFFGYRLTRTFTIVDPRLGHHRTLLVGGLGLLLQLLIVAIEEGASGTALTGALGLRGTHTALVCVLVAVGLALTHGGAVLTVYTAKDQLVTTEAFLRQFKGHALFDDADVDLRGMSAVIAARAESMGGASKSARARAAAARSVPTPQR